MNGVEFIKRVRARYSDVRILVASMHDESLFAERCLRAGANGYVNKEVATDVVVVAINRVLDGHLYLSAEMTNRMLHGAINSDSSGQSSLETLTDRELEVFALIRARVADARDRGKATPKRQNDRNSPRSHTRKAKRRQHDGTDASRRPMGARKRLDAIDLPAEFITPRYFRVVVVIPKPDSNWYRMSVHCCSFKNLVTPLTSSRDRSRFGRQFK